jgi:hypothetical protein
MAEVTPQTVVVVDESGHTCELTDARLNFDKFEPGRYLVNYVRIDDTQAMPGIAKFTIKRNDDTKEELYGTLGRDYPPADPDAD